MKDAKERLTPTHPAAFSMHSRPADLLYLRAVLLVGANLREPKAKEVRGISEA